jgi:hypothetical protein
MRTESHVDPRINKTFAVIAAMLTAGIVAAAVARSSSVHPDDALIKKANASVAAEDRVQRSGTLVEYPLVY